MRDFMLRVARYLGDRCDWGLLNKDDAFPLWMEAERLSASPSPSGAPEKSISPPAPERQPDTQPYDTFNTKAWMRRALEAEASVTALTQQVTDLEAQLAAAKAANQSFERAFTDAGKTHAEWKAQIAQKDQQIAQLTAERNEARGLHQELVLQVATKHPNETRHETAKRYIRQHEAYFGQGGPMARQQHPEGAERG